MATNYLIHEFQLKDAATGAALLVSGNYQVCVAGSPVKVAVVDPANGFGAFSGSPYAFTITAGKGRFAVLDTVQTVDIYVLTAQGYFGIVSGAKASGMSEVLVNSLNPIQRYKIPFAITDAVAATERDTGFDLPQDALVLMDTAVLVNTLEASRTINVGTLSSEGGGSANGLIAAQSLATAGLQAQQTVATATRGALFTTIATTPVTPDKGYSTRANAAKSLSYTLSASTVNANGWIILPVMLAA